MLTRVFSWFVSSSLARVRLFMAALLVVGIGALVFAPLHAFAQTSATSTRTQHTSHIGPNYVGGGGGTPFFTDINYTYDPASGNYTINASCGVQQDQKEGPYLDYFYQLDCRLWEYQNYTLVTTVSGYVDRWPGDNTNPALVVPFPGESSPPGTFWAVDILYGAVLYGDQTFTVDCIGDFTGYGGPPAGCTQDVEESDVTTPSAPTPTPISTPGNTPTPGATPTSNPQPTPTTTPPPPPPPTVYHYDYSSLFWGTNTGSTVDLAEAAYDSRSPNWGKVDVSSGLRSKGQDIPSLASNKGSPEVVSYVDSSGVTRLDVFALGANGAIGHYDYDSATSTWAYAGIGASSVGLPALQPAALALTPWEGLYGITAAGHLITYFTNAAPYGAWQSGDITQETGFTQTCDARIRPAVTSFNGTVEVFADCGGKLTQFFYSSGWHVNQAIAGGLSIPNVSVSFPGHSIAATVTPGANPSMEVYVVSDQNGVNALSQALYTSSGGWTQNRLPATSFAPDQVYATSQGVPAAGNGPASEVVVTGAPDSACSSAAPPSAQYVYQPANPNWHITSLPDGGVTGLQSIVEPSGSVFTEAETGAYTASGGCSSPSHQLEYQGSRLFPDDTQRWSTTALAGGSLPYPDNAGTPPAGNIFDYALQS